MSVENESKYQVAENLTVATLSGEAVILDSSSGRYYGLNEVGAQVFSLAHTPLGVDEIVDAMLGEYDVTPDKLKEDVTSFLSEMVEKSLIRVC